MTICTKVPQNTEVRFTVIRHPLTGEKVTPFEVIVNRYNIITTESYVHNVWVNDASITIFGAGYSSLHSFDNQAGQYCGGYCSYFDNKPFEHLKPYTMERSTSVQDFFRQRENESYALIAQAFPYTASSVSSFKYKHGGEVDMQADDIVAGEATIQAA